MQDCSTTYRQLKPPSLHPKAGSSQTFTAVKAVKQRPNGPGLEVLLQNAQTRGDSSPPEPSTLALQAEARLVRAFLENTNDPGTTRGCREGSFEVLNSEDSPNRIIHSQLSPGNGLRSFQPAFQSRVSIAKEQQTFEESPPGQGTRLNN